MAKLIINNLTVDQARVFLDWYDGQGEQDAEAWFENKNISVPILDWNTFNEGNRHIINSKVSISCK